MAQIHFSAEELGNVWAELYVSRTNEREIKRHEAMFKAIAKVNAESVNARYGESNATVTIYGVKLQSQNLQRQAKGLSYAVSTMSMMISNCTESPNDDDPVFLGAVCHILGELLYKMTQNKEGFINKETSMIEQIKTLKAENASLRVMARGDNTHCFRKGDILESTWGYGQTNIDFYLVAGITKTMVKLQKMDKITRQNGNMTATELPDIGTNKGKIIRRKVQVYDNREFVMIEGDYQTASKWDGNPAHSSSYH